MMFELEYGEARKIGHFWKGGGLFREVNVSRDPDESDLRAD